MISSWVITSAYNRYVIKDLHTGYQHPYEDTDAIFVSKRVFLRSTKDIKAGEELYVSYGSIYLNKFVRH